MIGDTVPKINKPTILYMGYLVICTLLSVRIPSLVVTQGTRTVNHVHCKRGFLFQEFRDDFADKDTEVTFGPSFGVKWVQ